MDKQEVKDAVFNKYHHVLSTLMSLFEVKTFEDIFMAAEQLQADNKRLEKELENARKYVKALNQALKE